MSPQPPSAVCYDYVPCSVRFGRQSPQSNCWSSSPERRDLRPDNTGNHIIVKRANMLRPATLFGEIGNPQAAHCCDDCALSAKTVLLGEPASDSFRVNDENIRLTGGRSSGIANGGIRRLDHLR